MFIETIFHNSQTSPSDHRQVDASAQPHNGVLCKKQKVYFEKKILRVWLLEEKGQIHKEKSGER